VIVAHGAAIPLANVEGALRVLVTAPYEARVARLATNGLGEVNARRNIDESDAARADFLERFYELESEEPTHYDLVVNTEKLGVDAAARAILSIVR
jgi:cytidylate kinase